MFKGRSSDQSLLQKPSPDTNACPSLNREVVIMVWRGVNVGVPSLQKEEGEKYNSKARKVAVIFHGSTGGGAIKSE